MTAHIYYTSLHGYKYRVHETYLHQCAFKGLGAYSQALTNGSKVDLSPSGLLTIHAGFMYDGPSGPTKDDKTNMRGAAVHDALYAMLRHSKLPKRFRKLADQEFLRCLKEDGMWWWRRRMYFMGVRRFAAFAAKPRKNGEKVYRAP